MSAFNTASTSSSGASGPSASNDEKRVLDLVFVMDCTGSMGSYIQQAKQTIRNIVGKLVSHEQVGLRFGLVAYRDHPPQEDTYVTRVYPFTDSADQMATNLEECSPQGGGDGPEAVTAGMHAALYDMEWRVESTKLVIIIADAPPHGVSGRGDGFPEGDPNGHDPLEIARTMATRGITLYSVICEPAISSYLFARAFFLAISTLTGGQTIALDSAELLADVVMGGALEEMALERLVRETAIIREEEEARIRAHHGRQATEEEILHRLETHYATRTVSVHRADLVGGEVREEMSTHFMTSPSLVEARAKLPTPAHHGAMEAAMSPLPAGRAMFKRCAAPAFDAAPMASTCIAEDEIDPMMFSRSPAMRAAPGRMHHMPFAPGIVPATSMASPSLSAVHVVESPSLTREQLGRLATKSKARSATPSEV